MSKSGWALVTLGLIVCATSAQAFELTQEAQDAGAEWVWLFCAGVAVLVLCAAFAVRAVMKRPRGARFWEVVLVVVGLGLAVGVWLLVCVAVWWDLLFPRSPSA